MRTKALVLAAALAAGTALTSMAQTVYSINAVGYVNLTIPAGFSMIANPLNTTNNTIGALFLAPPEGTTIYKYTGAGFVNATFLFGAWDNPNYTLNPGEGCFVYNPEAAFTNTFVGEVVQSPNSTTPLTNTFPVGFSIRASQVPQQANADALNLTAAVAEGDTIYRLTPGGGYTSYTYLFGAWDNVPTFNVGEAFWINATAGGTWTRTFTVNE